MLYQSWDESKRGIADCKFFFSRKRGGKCGADIAIFEHIQSSITRFVRCLFGSHP